MLKQKIDSTAKESLEICVEKSAFERKLSNGEEKSVSSNNTPTTLMFTDKNVNRYSTKCKICFLEFSCEYNLRRHEEYFSGAKYQCRKCETKFADKRQLRIHTGTAHAKKIPELRYRCHFCGQMFKHAINLQPHLYHYHGPQKYINITKNGISECTVNSEKTEKTVFIDDNYYPKVTGDKNLVANNEISLTLSRKSRDKKTMNRKFRNDKPKHPKFNTSVRKQKRKNLAGNARLISVLSEAAAIFSETDVSVPYENDYRDESSKKEKNIENLPVISKSNDDPKNQSAPTCIPLKASTTQINPNTSVTFKKTDFMTEKVLEKNAASEIQTFSTKSENLYHSLAISVENSKMENSDGTTIINGRNVGTNEKNNETKTSQKNDENCIKSGNIDVNVSSNTRIDDVPEIIENENESLQNVMERIILNKKRKSDVVKSYEVLNCEKTKRTDKTSTIRGANDMASEIIQTNVKKIGYLENSEKMNNIRIEYVIDYRDDDKHERIGENKQMTEKDRFFQNPRVIESDSVNHTMGVQTIKNIHEKADSFSNLVKFPSIKNSGKSLVPIDPGSTLNSLVSRNNENPEKTAVFYITNDGDSQKVQAPNTSIKNVQNFVRIENRFNSINNTNEDSHRRIQEIEKPSSVSKVSSDSENMILIVNPIPSVPDKPKENNESLKEKERSSIEFYSIPLMENDECVFGSNVSRKTYECFENVENLSEIERKEIGFRANDNPNKNRLAKIIDKIVASSTTKVVSSSSLSTFIDPIDGIVSVRECSDSLVDDREKSEAECDKLKERYSCKECYVSIPKMTIANVNLSKMENSLATSSEKLPNNSKCTTLVSPYRVSEANFLSETLTNRISDLYTIVRSVICSMVLPTASSMRQHYRDVHSIFSDERKICACGKSMNGNKEDHFFSHAFRTSFSTTPHPFISEPCKPLKKTEICAKCGEGFWLKACLEYHRSKCTQPTVLSAKTTSITNKRQEVARGPNAFKDQLTCPVCYAEFLTLAAFNKHIKIYAKPANHRCLICGTSFMGKRLLDGHKRTAHNSKLPVDYEYNCGICDQVFLKAIYRRVHMMHIHGEKCLTDIIRNSKFNENPIFHEKCKTCYQEFVNRERFVEHLIYYEKEETIVCKICDREFPGRYKAHRHNKLRHYSANIRSAYPLKCPVCHEGFAFMEHFQAHVSHVHGRNVDGTDNENAPRSNDGVKRNRETSVFKEKSLADNTNIQQLHICDICETSFPTFDLLVDHQVEYRNDGKFACSRCGRRCTTATLLLDHLSLNHSGTVYDSIKCHRCAENILTPAAWISHVKHYHASHVREPSEFYFEMNFSSTKEFGMEKLDLIPKNIKIANGSTYEMMGNINRSLLKNGSMNMQNGEGKKTDIVRSSDGNIIKDSTSGLIEFNTNPNSLKDVTGNMQNNGEKKNADISRSPDTNLVNVSPSNLKWKSIKRKSLENVMANRKTNGGKKQARIGCTFDSSVTSHVSVSKIVKSGTIKANWKCDTCDQYFHGSAAFARHKAHYSNAGPHLCEICTRRFPSPVIFQEHKVTHERTGIKYNYLCGICNQRFGTLCWLKIHNAHLHPESGQIRNSNVNSLVQRSVVSSSTTPSVDSSPTSLSNDTPCTIVSQPEASSPRIRTDDPIQAISDTLLDTDHEELALSNALNGTKTGANNGPSYVYQCPNCTQRYYHFQQLREHFRSSHKIIVPDDANTDAPTGHTGNVGFSSELEMTVVACRNPPTDQTSKTTTQHALPVSIESDTHNAED